MNGKEENTNENTYHHLNYIDEGKKN